LNAARTSAANRKAPSRRIRSDTSRRSPAALHEARLAFEKMLTYANHVGLYAEQISRAGQQQGNFPQALTHLALISAAFNLDRALGA
jgi:GH15 family glucan-1,4-alpha-glucosidase